ncbi:MAG: sulfatase-like hydrolase/transferase, partial [Candidatus Paceibacteria bacterium]
SNIWGDTELRTTHENIDSLYSIYYLNNQKYWELQSFEALYDGCIRQLDTRIRELIKGLREEGEYENTLIIITSDHGETFGERSRVSPDTRLIDHSWGIHESLLHVPLLIKNPYQNNGEIVEDLVSLVDIPEKILDVVEHNEDEWPDSMYDFVLSSTYRLPDQHDINEIDNINYTGPWRAVFKEENEDVYKYIDHHNDQATVFVKNSQESCKLSTDDEGVVDIGFSKLESKDIKLDNRAMTDDVESRLQDLGYIRK